MKYVLASNSPRRKEILAQCNISFDVIPSSYDEALENDDFSYPLIENIALQKAKSTAQKIKFPALIISADTLVVFEGKIFAKPKDKNEAKQMLKSLSDKTHSVVTAHCVLNTTSNKAQIKSDTSYVTFFPLSDEKIEDYIEKFKPFDKAGAYGIQEMPEGYIKECKGSLTNVIGLSKDVIIKLLARAQA